MHARHRACRLDIDACDGRMRVRAASKSDVQHVGQGDVVEKVALPCQQGRVFQPRHAFTDDAPQRWLHLQIFFLERTGSLEQILGCAVFDKRLVF